MANIRLTIRWLLRAWPFLVTAALAAIHYCVYLQMRDRITSINTITSSTLQVLGGLIVLYSVNQNMGLFKRRTLFAIAIEWCRSCPAFKKPMTVINATGAFLGLSAHGAGSVEVSTKCDTIDERVEELERQVKECRSMILNSAKRLDKRIGDVKTTLTSDIAQRGKEIAEMKSLLHESVVGGISTQVFGVLLVIYGAVVGLI